MRMMISRLPKPLRLHRIGTPAGAPHPWHRARPHLPDRGSAHRRAGSAPFPARARSIRACRARERRGRMAVMEIPFENGPQSSGRAALAPSGTMSGFLRVSGAHRRPIGFHIGPLRATACPARHHLGHTFGGASPNCACATPPFTLSWYSAISPSFSTKRLMPSITISRPLIGRALVETNARQRTGITDIAVHDRIEERPVIFRSIAVEEVFQHVRDGRAASVRAVDIVEITSVGVKHMSLSAAPSPAVAAAAKRR